MNEGLRSGKMALYGTVLMMSWSLMPMMSPVAYSQPLEPVPVEPVVPPPTTAPPATRPPTPAEVERAKEADRAKEAERLKQSGQTTDQKRAVETETRVEKKKIRPHETYVAGFGGVNFASTLNNLTPNNSIFPGTNLRDHDLTESGVYGGKIGHFFGGGADWLGLEVEGYHASPHIEQQGFTPGTHFTVTTLAFNLIGRLKLGCETKTDHVDTRTEKAGTRTDTRAGDYTYSERKDPNTGEVYTERKDLRTGELSAERKDPVTGEVYTEYRDPKMGELYREKKDPKTGQVYTERRDPRTGQLVRTEKTEKTEKDVRTVDREIRHETRYERDFCRLQPYAGAGLGLFWADLGPGANGNTASDHGAPGLNLLAGLRFYFTEHVALFGEYKYNYAPLDFSGGPFTAIGGQGLKGDYQANIFVGGLSFHF